MWIVRVTWYDLWPFEWREALIFLGSLVRVPMLSQCLSISSVLAPEKSHHLLLYAWWAWLDLGGAEDSSLLNSKSLKKTYNNPFA